jgi:hypothetical protein
MSSFVHINQRRRNVLTLLGVLLLLLIFFLVLSGMGSKNVELSYRIVDNSEDNIFNTNEIIRFYNDTETDDTAIWDVGMSGPIKGNSIELSFQKPGEYKGKVVVGELTKEFTLYIEDSLRYDTELKTLVHGPEFGFVGDEVIFYASQSNANQWIWTFSNDNSMEYGQRIRHVFERPGYYTVLLETDLDEMVEHQIFIKEPFTPIPEEPIEPEVKIDRVAIIEDSLRWYLQQIADTPLGEFERFRFYRNATLKKYLKPCKAEMTPVSVDGQTLDFYSYCQRLHHLYSSDIEHITIDAVTADYDTLKQCVLGMEVTHKKKK